jgi:hypothetical protein
MDDLVEKVPEAEDERAWLRCEVAARKIGMLTRLLT